MSRRKRREPALPDVAPRNQAVVDRLLARLSELEFCEHDPDGFALWISTRPGMLLCGFCYQAAQVLAENIRCTACSRRAGHPDKDAIVVLKVTDWLGAHFYLCQCCTAQDLRVAGHEPG